jgi:hypothetical protein
MSNVASERGSRVASATVQPRLRTSERSSRAAGPCEHLRLHIDELKAAAGQVAGDGDAEVSGTRPHLEHPRRRGVAGVMRGPS